MTGEVVPATSARAIWVGVCVGELPSALTIGIAGAGIGEEAGAVGTTDIGNDVGTVGEDESAGKDDG